MRKTAFLKTQLGVCRYNLASCRRIWGMTGLGGFVYAVAVNPEDPFSAAVACGDGTLRALDVQQKQQQPQHLGIASGGGGGQGGTLLWRGLPQTKVTCMAWHPVEDTDDGDGGGGGGGGGGSGGGGGGGGGGRGGVLAAGLEDGRVVIVDTLAGGGRGRASNVSTRPHSLPSLHSLTCVLAL